MRKEILLKLDVPDSLQKENKNLRKQILQRDKQILFLLNKLTTQVDEIHKQISVIRFNTSK